MIVKLENISKHFGSLSLLKGINLTVFEGDIIAIVGPNGCGKTTLINIISGELEPDEGLCEYKKSLKLSILRQIQIPRKETGIFDYIKEEIGYSDKYLNDIGIEEYIDLELFDIDTDIKKVLSGFGFLEKDYYKPIASLSKGEYRRVLFAEALLRDSELLILDEPTNHLDLESIQWLENYIKTLKKTIIFISHDQKLIDNIANKILYIHQKKAYSFNGNWTHFKDQWNNLKLSAERQNQKVEKEKARLKSFIRKNLAGQKTKQAQSRRKQLLKLEDTETIREDKGVSFSFNNIIHNPPVISYCKNMEFAYDDLLFSDISFSIHKSDRIGIIGRNGSGKTTLLNLILGKVSPKKGEVFLNKNIKYFYLSQESYSEYEDLTITDMLRNYNPGMTRLEIMDMLGAYNLASKGENYFSSLSGGEKRRFQLAISQIGTFNLLIFDEPTNHLDIFSIENLIKGINEYNGCCIFITHNRYFLDSIANKIIEIKDRQANLYHGNYSYYLYKKASIEEDIPQEKDPGIKEIREQKPEISKNKLKEIKARQKEIEEQIIEYEEEKESLLHNEFSDPDLYKDREKYLKVKARLDAVNNNIDRLLEQLEKFL